MRKRLLSLVTALVLACSLAPGIALADPGDPIPITIEVGANGVPVDASGDGWTYENDKLTLQAGYAFTLEGGTEGNTLNARVDNFGIIKDGKFNGSVFNGSDEGEGAGIIAGGTFSNYVYNYEGSVISGGAFNDGNNNSVNNSGTITGGEFNIDINNSGTIENGTFNSGVQNYSDGTILGGTFNGENSFNYGVISDGAFNSEMTYNFGEIRGGAFYKAVDSSDAGTISGGTFTRTSSVLSYYGGTISGGTFEGSVSNCDADFNPEYNRATITGGTFKGAVTNYDTIEDGAFSSVVTNEENGTITGGTFLSDMTNRGAIEGGFFALPIIGDGGTMSAGTFPVHTTLTGLSIAQAARTELVVSYAKDSEEVNSLVLKADEGYRLPDAIAVSLGSADGSKLVAGTDYTYDTATGAIAIKKGAASGPLFLSASGQPAPAPTPKPTPPTPEPPTPDAKPLAATGDSALLPTVVAGIALLAAGALAASAAARRNRRASRR